MVEIRDQGRSGSRNNNDVKRDWLRQQRGLPSCCFRIALGSRDLPVSCLWWAGLQPNWGGLYMVGSEVLESELGTEVLPIGVCILTMS